MIEMLNDKMIVSKDSNYAIYKLTNVQNISYYAYISSKQVSKYRMFVGFPLGNGSDMITDVKTVGDKLMNDYSDCVYVVPLIDMKRLNNDLVNSGDDLYKSILSEIQTVTNDVAIKIFENKERKISFEQMINFVLQNDVQKKFVSWLDKKMSNYIHSVDMINDSGKNFFDSLQEIYGDGQISIDEELIKKNDEFVFAQSDKNLVQRINNRNEDLFNIRNGLENKSNNLYVDSIEDNDKTNKNSKATIKKRAKYSSGFGKVVGFILLLIVSLFIGLGIGYLVLG